VTDQGISTQSNTKKQPLISGTAWIVCSILGFLSALGNASRSGATGREEFIEVLLGAFVGGLLFFLAIWAVIMLIYRFIKRKRPVA
jgi:hypothetical protein